MTDEFTENDELKEEPEPDPPLERGDFESETGGNGGNGSNGGDDKLERIGEQLNKNEQIDDTIDESRKDLGDMNRDAMKQMVLQSASDVLDKLPVPLPCGADTLIGAARAAPDIKDNVDNTVEQMAANDQNVVNDVSQEIDDEQLQDEDLIQEIGATSLDGAGDLDDLQNRLDTQNEELRKAGEEEAQRLRSEPSGNELAFEEDQARLKQEAEARRKRYEEEGLI